MGLEFLHPVYLYSLTAAAVPLVIHLIHRRRARVRDFPSLRFILSSNRRIARRHRLHQWLLMLLRVSAICLFALVLAGAVLRTEREAGLAPQVPRASVLILDDTVTMRFMQGGLERFLLAKRAAREILERMTEADRAAILLLSGSEGVPGRLVREKALLLARLEGIAPSYRAGDMAGALESAYALLSGAPEPQRVIWLVSDMTRHEWRGFSMAAIGKVDAAVELRCLRFGGELRDANAAVLDVRAPSWRLEKGVPVVLEATIANFSDEELRRAVVQLSVDGRRREVQLVDVPSNGRRTVEFRTTLDEVGFHRGSVELAADALAVDDTFYLTLETLPKLRALLVDGDPRTSLLGSETYYLRNALNPERSIRQAAIVPTVVTVDELVRTALQPFQVVVLCNVREVPEGVRSGLMAHVAAGGGLLIFLGDQVDLAAYDRIFYGSETRLLPARLAEATVARWDEPARIGSVAYAHPILRVFAEEGAGNFESARFYRYAALADHAVSGERPLLTLTDGSPYLVEGRVGKGRVLLFTSTADRDWNDLSTRPVYVPLMQQAVRYAAGMLEGPEGASGSVGEPRRFVASASAVGRSIRVTNPTAVSATVWFERDGDKARAVYPQNDVPGIYQVDGEGIGLLYAVNLGREESDLAKISSEELEALLPGIPVSVSEYQDAGSVLRAGLMRTMDLSVFLLLALGAVLVAEGAVANRG